jgi:hypothetical protein
MSEWNTTARPTDRLVKAKRVAADTGVLYEVFIQDAYNKAERKVIDRTRKSPGELKFKLLLE